MPTPSLNRWGVVGYKTLRNHEDHLQRSSEWLKSGVHLFLLENKGVRGQALPALSLITGDRLKILSCDRLLHLPTLQKSDPAVWADYDAEEIG